MDKLTKKPEYFENWIRDCLVPDEGYFVTGPDLYDAFRAEAQRHGQDLSPRMFEKWFAETYYSAFQPEHEAAWVTLDFLTPKQAEIALGVRRSEPARVPANDRPHKKGCWTWVRFRFDGEELL